MTGNNGQSRRPCFRVIAQSPAQRSRGFGLLSFFQLPFVLFVLSVSTPSHSEAVLSLYLEMWLRTFAFLLHVATLVDWTEELTKGRIRCLLQSAKTLSPRLFFFL